MDLHKRLSEIRRAFETGDTPREIVDVLNDHVENLLASNVGDKALQVGEQAAMDLTVQTSSGLEPLSHFLRERFLVLTWFRGNW